MPQNMLDKIREDLGINDFKEKVQWKDPELIKSNDEYNNNLKIR